VRPLLPFELWAADGTQRDFESRQRASTRRCSITNATPPAGPIAAQILRLAWSVLVVLALQTFVGRDARRVGANTDGHWVYLKTVPVDSPPLKDIPRLRDVLTRRNQAAVDK
jgi:hypothetical protein